MWSFAERFHSHTQAVQNYCRQRWPAALLTAWSPPSGSFVRRCVPFSTQHPHEQSITNFFSNLPLCQRTHLALCRKAHSCTRCALHLSFLCFAYYNFYLIDSTDDVQMVETDTTLYLLLTRLTSRSTDLHALQVLVAGMFFTSLTLYSLFFPSSSLDSLFFLFLFFVFCFVFAFAFLIYLFCLMRVNGMFLHEVFFANFLLRLNRLWLHKAHQSSAADDGRQRARSSSRHELGH